MPSLLLALALAAAEPAVAAPVVPVADAPAAWTPDVGVSAPSLPVAPVAPQPPTPTPTSTSTSTSTPKTPTPTPAAHPAPKETRPAPLAEVVGAIGRAEAHAAKAPREGGPTSPSLAPGALAEELRKAAKDRRSDQAAMEEERRKLEKLRDEVGTSRKALQSETARLEELLGKGPPSAKAGAKGGKTGKAKGLDSPLEALAKTVKGMKADQAAALLARLDRPLAAAILDRMRPGDAAVVLDKMEPGTGAELFALLARRNDR
jgi:flagellar motility protein MotE (MotC chaperone)